MSTMATTYNMCEPLYNQQRGVVMEKHDDEGKQDAASLRPDLQEVVKDVLALRALAKTDNFLTHRSQRALLGRLNPIDLARVARVLAELK